MVFLLGMDPPTAPHAAQPGNRILKVSVFVSLSLPTRSDCHEEDRSYCIEQRAALNCDLRMVLGFQALRDPYKLLPIRRECAATFD